MDTGVALGLILGVLLGIPAGLLLIRFLDRDDIRQIKAANRAIKEGRRG